jgi:hypothetical protein
VNNPNQGRLLLALLLALLLFGGFFSEFIAGGLTGLIASLPEWSQPFVVAGLLGGGCWLIVEITILGPRRRNRRPPRG